jgi:archaemetzincin
MKDRIILIPYQGVSREFLAGLSGILANIFNQATEIGLGMIIKSSAWRPGRQQFNADVILDALPHPDSGSRMLGVLDADIYAFGLNFIFGEADSNSRKALISLTRLRPEFYGCPENTSIFQDRILKEAVHELGHTYRLRHCPNQYCVMHFSNSIEDTDNKSWQFCSNCQKRLKDRLLTSSL